MLKNWFLVGLVGLSLSTASFAEVGSLGAFGELPPEIVSEVFGQFPSVFDQSKMVQAFPPLFLKATSSHQFKLGEDSHLFQTLIKLEQQFMEIPDGFLPSKNQPHSGELISVSSFQADRYAVTQALWQVFMKDLSDDVQLKCPNCPIVGKNLAQVGIFLKKLNEAAKKSGQCWTYDLPTDSELDYMMRGDVSGLRPASYTVVKDEQGNLIEVTNENRDEYVIHSGNSDTDGAGPKLQPVDSKKPNAFGLHILGNVRRMSKTYTNQSCIVYGLVTRGGSFTSDVNYVRSHFRQTAKYDEDFNEVGFTLVRRCSQDA
jgi:formylglycine-generating enzyme required for sulfatase activity